ncbi:MAG: septum formation inhibitor Maf [Methylococcaceae bacterium]|nr:septum formation inhibitor Maf [Methylococcaceae bacterium]
MSEQIILASNSPRRRELLTQLGVNYIVRPVDTDETPLEDELPLDYVQRVAAEKSALCASLTEIDLPILAADTAVVLDNHIMGKPENQQHAAQMLSLLSGKTHQVYSALSFRGKQHWQVVNITNVTFRNIKPTEMAAYWQTGEPQDKAGGYAIQGLGSIFIKSINGSFSGVMGLPLFETAELLAKQGIQIIHE